MPPTHTSRINYYEHVLSGRATSQKDRIIYRPPRRGSPVRRSGGGVRGGSHAPPNPLVLAIVTGTLRNVGLGVSALHALYINRRLLPRELRPSRFLQVGLVAAFFFFLGISGIAFRQQLLRLLAARQ